MLRPLLAALLLAGPAGAEQASLTWRASPGEARLLGAALALHALRERLEDEGDDRASIRQWGRENAALLTQSGGASLGVVRQRGRGHEARLEQRGGRNLGVVVQVGRGARALLEQEGGEAEVTLQLGW